MNFTNKAKEHIDSCRFCWMCHHVCPIGNATGLERNTARARALGLSLVARDAVEYSDDIINNVYECSLCGGCMTDCVTGWDPVMFTKEARQGAALDGKLPEYIMNMINNLMEKGNIYGADQNPNIPELSDSETLFFLGEDVRAKGCAKNAVELFSEITGKQKDLAINVDFYSGFVYKMLNIPQEVYTPIFAMSRIAGWCAHRLEEIMVSDKIIRPAYKNVYKGKEYTNINER